MRLERLIGRNGRVCIWCERELWRLTTSPSRPLSEYGARQLALLERIASQ